MGDFREVTTIVKPDIESCEKEEVYKYKGIVYKYLMKVTRSMRFKNPTLQYIILIVYIREFQMLDYLLLLSISPPMLYYTLYTRR